MDKTLKQDIQSLNISIFEGETYILSLRNSIRNFYTLRKGVEIPLLTNLLSDLNDTLTSISIYKSQL